MSGTYKQSASSDQSGTLVFTPTDTSTKSSAQVETDEYQLVQGGRELRLTSEGDTMVFAKQGSR